MPANPCIRCGACCAMFCVSFPEQEADDLPGGFVPVAMTLPQAKGHRIMKGTMDRYPRCVALSGTIGSRVKCGIYEHRPSVCRAFDVSWKHCRANRLCDKARSVYGLEPFAP